MSSLTGSTEIGSTQDKLLAKMEEPADTLLDEDEECVVCLGARATMQTFPCQHRVVCRKCFIRTIQVAVKQRSLPLRCVVCRARIVKLRHSASGSKAVSVSSPFRSSSTPPPMMGGGDSLGQVHDGFILNDNNNNNNGNVANNNHKSHSVVGKVAPCCAQGSGRKDGKPATSAFVPDPPRVTLVKAAAKQLSPLSRSVQATRREASPSPMMTSTPGKSAKTSVSARATSAKPDITRNKQGDVIGEAPPVAGKGSHSQSSRRGKGFHFKPLFWR